MTEQILEISERGQITIPKKMREMFKGSIVSIKLVKNQIILTPVQTVDKFFEELDEAYEDWKKNGGYTLDEIKKMHDL